MKINSIIINQKGDLYCLTINYDRGDLAYKECDSYLSLLKWLKDLIKVEIKCEVEHDKT